MTDRPRFRIDDRLERLRTMKAKEPERYAKLRAVDKMSVGFYENQRAQAAAAGIDVDGDAA